MSLLPRRTILRGLGVAVGLPFLEAMVRPRNARASTVPLRYLVAFAGASPMPLYPPTRLGAGYDLGLGLRPLGGRAVKPVPGRPSYAWDGVHDAFSVVSNLKMPSAGPGAFVGPWHSAVVGPLLSGVTSSAADSPHPRGITSDLVVAGAGPAALRFRWLGYRVQPQPYRDDDRFGLGTMSHNGRTLLPPVHSPRAAYDQFFRGFAHDGGDTASAQALARDRSVLDLVSWRARRLETRLGTADRRRLDEHFTQIREMERRINALPSATVSGGACVRLPDPGPDPGAAVVPARDDAKHEPIGYAGEHERALVFADLLYLAFACDHARAASLMFTYPMSCQDVGPIIGDRRVDFHDLGHGGGTAADMARAVSWHVEHLARLADRLRKTSEDDTNLLDRTAIVFVTEGGCTENTHSGDGFCLLVGGGRAGGLVQGRHFDGKGRHPVQVLVSAMQATGVAVDKLGEVEGRIDELHR